MSDRQEARSFPTAWRARDTSSGFSTGHLRGQHAYVTLNGGLGGKAWRIPKARAAMAPRPTGKERGSLQRANPRESAGLLDQLWSKARSRFLKSASRGANRPFTMIPNTYLTTVKGTRCTNTFTFPALLKSSQGAPAN